MNKPLMFEVLKNNLLQCSKCPRLVESRKEVQGKIHHPILPAGNLDAKILLVGEAPGRSSQNLGDDQERNKPFAYGSGTLLDEMLKYIGLSRDDVFVTNILCCNTPESGEFIDEEIVNCKYYLNKIIELVRPKLIVAMGAFAIEHITKIDMKMNAGDAILLLDGALLYYIWHPAYVQREPGRLKEYKTQWARLKKYLE